MNKPIFRSTRQAFNRKNEDFIDMVTGNMSIELERNLKKSSGMPVKQGLMKASTRSFRVDRGKHRTEVNKEYAAVQEVGQRMSGKGAPTRAFKNYTTPGTSAGWFSRAIDSTLQLKDGIIEQARRAVGL